MGTDSIEGRAVLTIPQGSLGTNHSVCSMLNVKCLSLSATFYQERSTCNSFFPLVNDHFSDLPGLLVKTERVIVINYQQVSG